MISTGRMTLFIKWEKNNISNVQSVIIATLISAVPFNSHLSSDINATRQYVSTTVENKMFSIFPTIMDRA